MKLRRTLHPEVRVLDSKAGTVEYIASDETIDSYREIIRADGWRFNRFTKNAPFVDSHDYSTLDKLLGNVVDFRVKGKQLIETVRWAIDVEENRLAKLGWKMTEAGYLKAVSVGFIPTRMVSKWDQNPQAFAEALAELELPKDSPVRAIYQEQEQIELSAVVIGANPNALAKAYKADAITTDDLNFLAAEFERRAKQDQPTPKHAPATDHSALVAWADARTAQAFLDRIEQLTKRI